MNRNHILLTLVVVIVLSFIVFGQPVKEIPATLTIGAQAPNMTNIELNDNISGDDDMILAANDTTVIWCAGDLYDLDGFTDYDSGNGTIWNSDMLSFGDSEDNRYYYTNSSCDITEVTGTPNVNGLINCTFSVWFYANYSQWNCTLTVNDSYGYGVNGTDNATMNKLLAINSPNASIDWGVRAVDTAYDADLDVSIYNEGNVVLDLQLDAYNDTSVGIPSNYSFDCLTGQIRTDAIVYNGTPGGIYADSTNLDNDTYLNITGFDLGPQDGTSNSPTNESAYFGIYIPSFPTINGTCSGWMRFEAMDGSPPP